MNKTKKIKDGKLIKFLNNKILYIILAAIVLIYAITNSQIINYPKYIEIISYFVSGFIVLLIIGWRYIKYSDYYKKKIKEKYYIVKAIIIYFISLFFIRVMFFIVLNTIVKYNAKDSPVESFNVEILNVHTNTTPRNISNIQYKFRDNIYSTYIELPSNNKADIINKYKLIIYAKESLFGSYYIEKMLLEDNVGNTNQ